MTDRPRTAGSHDRQIIAMGGGGFTMEPDNPLLDEYVLAQTGKERPRICLLGTASGDSATMLRSFYEAFGDGRADPCHLRLFGRPRTDLAAYMLACDAIYVGGGNTANMLAVWRLHGVDVALRAAWEAGVVLAGLSAGMICWYEAGVTDSFGPLAPLDDGLGFLPGSACPHYDGEKDRRPRYHAFLTDGFCGGVAADDGAAFHYRGTELVGCIASRIDARGYSVTCRDGDVHESALATRFLGAV